MRVVSIARIWNQVSSLVLGSEDTVEWYSAINNFVAIPRFIPPGLDASTHEGFPAFGPNNDLLPLDVNVTFFFDYDKGFSDILLDSFIIFFKELSRLLKYLTKLNRELMRV